MQYILSKSLENCEGNFFLKTNLRQNKQKAMKNTFEKEICCTFVLKTKHNNSAVKINKTNEKD